MGSPEEGQQFAAKHPKLFKKYREGYGEEWSAAVPLFVDTDRELYKHMELKRPDSLMGLYASTVDVETITSAFNAVKSGFMPTYSAGGDLLQLGGTIIVASDEIMYAHLDESTGGHAPVEDLLKHSE